MHSLITTLLVAFAPACYPPPVDAPVADPFIAPACDYCAGHRGLDYDVVTGTAVRAVADGVVRFSGVVAGTRYVVVLQDDGLTATYGGLAVSTEQVGEAVHVRDVVGTSAERFYFGLRDGDRYLDPQPHLGRWKRRARLVPSGGRPPRAARPPSLECSGTGAAWAEGRAGSPR